jgi:hypothetical protein
MDRISGLLFLGLVAFAASIAMLVLTMHQNDSGKYRQRCEAAGGKAIISRDVRVCIHRDVVITVSE